MVDELISKLPSLLREVTLSERMLLLAMVPQKHTTALWLLEHGANINAVDRQQKTALHVATTEAHTNPASLQTVACLLRNSIAMGIKDSSGKAAQDYCKTDDLIATFKGTR